MHSEPMLSIVIPAYNVAPYIKEAVESACRQTYRNIEVIIVDDGSTDDTGQIIDQLQRESADARIKVIHRENGGLAAARNTGVRATTGKFIGFLDSDDLWLAEKAERHMTQMMADSRIGISFSCSRFMEENGRPLAAILQVDRMQPSLHDMIRRNHIGNGSTPVVRKDCFDKAGLFNEELKSCEDYEMWCRILWATEYRAAAINEPLTLYRLRDTSLSFNFEKFVHSADMAMEALRNKMKNVPDRVLRAGHAEHYRIAAWKAASTHQDEAALRLLLRGIRIWPWLILTDWRAFGTFCALLFPGRSRARVASWVKSIRQRTASMSN